MSMRPAPIDWMNVKPHPPMRIDFPWHPIGLWKVTPFWLFWKSGTRRKHWRWTVDHRGCSCTYYWEYR